jgi:hypothetical protein
MQQFSFTNRNFFFARFHHLPCVFNVHRCLCVFSFFLFSTNGRAGFFIGDGAGVGKGRQIAAIILDNVVRGRRKHVW